MKLIAGIVADVKQDGQTDIHGTLDHHEDQASVKQSLISSYKKILYPALKQEIQQSNKDLLAFTSGTPRSKWHFLTLFKKLNNLSV